MVFSIVAFIIVNVVAVVTAITCLPVFIVFGVVVVAVVCRSRDKCSSSTSIKMTRRGALTYDRCHIIYKQCDEIGLFLKTLLQLCGLFRKIALFNQSIF